MLNTVLITKDGKDFHFAFDPETDDPAKGATLTGIFENGTRLRPSDFQAEEVPYAEAERELIRSTKLIAQDLYDLREATGFISGEDLHKAFTELVGEPSPKGATPVTIPNDHWLSLAAKELSNHQGEIYGAAEDYLGTDEGSRAAKELREQVYEFCMPQ
jgi:hypothetical protein